MLNLTDPLHALLWGLTLGIPMGWTLRAIVRWFVLRPRIKPEPVEVTMRCQHSEQTITLEPGEHIVVGVNMEKHP